MYIFYNKKKSSKMYKVLVVKSDYFIMIGKLQLVLRMYKLIKIKDKALLHYTAQKK